MKIKVMIEWLYLVIQDNGRSRVTGTTHDRAPSHDGCSMIVFFVKELMSYLNLRLGEDIMGWQVEYHWMGRLRVDMKIIQGSTVVGLA
jgi:hypothetical protein